MMVLLGGKPKKGGAAEEGMGAKATSSEDMMIDEFVSAVSDGDTEGARAAFKSAVRACMSAEEEGEYEDEEM